MLHREREKERREEIEYLPSAGSVPRWSEKHGLGKAEARSQELYPCVLHGYRGPNVRGLYCCFSQDISIKLDWK